MTGTRSLWLMSWLLCAAAAGAEQRTEPAPAADRADAGSSEPTLSKEDAELVKDLALLERMELLKNLELFEDPKQPDKADQRQQ